LAESQKITTSEFGGFFAMSRLFESTALWRRSKPVVSFLAVAAGCGYPVASAPYFSQLLFVREAFIETYRDTVARISDQASALSNRIVHKVMDLGGAAYLA
jgi:hypothetical protein